MQLQRLEMFPLSKKRADDASRHKAHNWQSGMPLSKTKVQCHGYGHMVHHSYFLSLQDRQSDQHHLEANRELLALFNFASSSCIRDTSPIFALAETENLFKALSAEETDALLRKFLTYQLVQLLVGRLM